MRAIWGVLVVLAASNCAFGQKSELYVNQLEHTQMVAVQAGSVVRSWNLPTAGENALAVAGTIRTAGNLWNSNNAAGGEYALDGTVIGHSYSIFPAGNWFDGTTDGVRYNYAIQHNGDYLLYRFDREWKNPQSLFSVGFPASGIALDRSTSTFWICNSIGKLVRHLDMSGATLASFTPDIPMAPYGLAFDSADRTLWIGGFGSNSIYQFALAGNRLGRVDIPGFHSAYGMEFAVPEPGTVALGLCGFVAAICARRRRWRVARNRC